MIYALKKKVLKVIRCIVYVLSQFHQNCITEELFL